MGKSFLRIALLTAGMFLAVTLVIAQDAPKPAPEPPAAKSEPALPPTALPSPDQAFQLGRLSAKMEELQSQYSGLVQTIVREHPGYMWDPSHNVLVLQPRPAAPKKEGK